MATSHMTILLGWGKGILPLILAALDLMPIPRSEMCQATGRWRHSPWTCPIIAQDSRTQGQRLCLQEQFTAHGDLAAI